MYEPILEKVLAAYGIRPHKVHAHQKGYRNEIWPVELPDGSFLNLTFFKREDGMARRVRRTDAVSEYLAERGMPTRQRADRRILRLKFGNEVVLAGVYTYLPGSTIPWEGYTMDHLKLLGKAMSDMHALLADIPSADTPSVYDEYNAILRRMSRYFADSQVTVAMRQKLGLELEAAQLEAANDLLRRESERPGGQVLHMDFVRGNILFGGPTQPGLALGDVRLSGILDFEKTALGQPVVDIARTLAFLLVDCKYKQSQKVYKYFFRCGHVADRARTPRKIRRPLFAVRFL
jgi:Ser/Thr protein kinase RdoA (MazF antagonist)